MGIFDLFGSIANLVAESRARAQEMELAQQNLDLQRYMFDRGDDLATAEREDAFGNTVGFDEELNKWVTDLTKPQKRLLKAGEAEQYRSVTEDADRERDQRRREEEMALQAGDVYNRQLVGYQYDQPESEDAIRSQIARSLALARSESGNEAKDIVGGQALRLGRGGDISKIIKAAQGGLSANDSLRARGLAAEESAGRERQHQSKYLPALRQFGALAGKGENTPQLFSNVDDKVTSGQNNILTAIQNALNSGATNMGNALTGTQSAIRPLDFGPLASSIGSTIGSFATGTPELEDSGVLY